MTVQQNKKRKRPAPPNLNEENDEVAAKTKKENITCVISEVEFKFLLSDQGTALEGLEKFIQLAENVAAGQATAGIVSAYCRSSQTCSELFDLIEPGRKQLKTNEMALVFRCLELILTRIRTDLVKFASTGEAIVQRILAGHMGQVYNGLQEQNKSKTMKASLQLLTAMVYLSERAKRAVQSRLNFGHVCFPALFRRRNRKDPNDVRSCAVLLTLAFLVDSDLNTISSLVQQKSFIQQTVAGLKYDRRDLVLEVLATLLDKVVTFPGLSKTDKVKLFSEAVLKQLCELYDWQGPTGWLPTSKKMKKKEDQVRVTPEGFSDDQEMVANVCHEFLVEVCCSHKNGVNFHDKTVGTGQRNHNQLLDHLVAWLVKKIDEQRKAVLVTEILLACPDLMKATLTNMGPSLSPRWSEKWRQLMTWLINLYRRLPDVPPFLGGQDYLKSAQGSVISMATVFCLPPPSVAAVITQGLKHEDIRVRDKCARLVQVSAKKASAIRDQLAAGTTAGGAGASAFWENLVEAFSARVMKTLPPTSQLFVCVDKTMQLMSAKQVDGLEAAVVDEKESAVDLCGHASVLLQILGLYQTLIPSLLSERPKDLAKLIDMVGCLQSHHQRKPPGGAEAVGNREGTSGTATGGTLDGESVQRWMPQLYLLKLLSDTDARKISLGREGLMEKLLLSASESHKFRNLTIGLVCKMLQGMEIFSEHVHELHTWLDIALSSASELQKTQKTSSASSPLLFNPVTFLARCLATLINNSSPYVDRVMEAVGEVSRASGIADKSHDLTSSGSSGSAIDAILLMDDQELDSRLDKCLPQVASSQHSSSIHLPLSPLAVVALDSLHYGKTAGDAGKEYVSAVLGHLLHSLPDPVILARIVTKSETKLSDGVREYIQYWVGGQAKRSVTRPLPAATFGVFTSAIMCKHFSMKSPHCTVKELSNQMRGMTSREKLIGLKQVLLYVGDTLKTLKQTAKCEEKVKAYLDLATSLSDHILTEESSKTHGDGLSDFRGFLTVSKDVSDDDVLDQEKVSADELDVFDVLFSRVVSSASDNVVTDALRCVLLNPTLKACLFKTHTEAPRLPGKKSSKRKEKVMTADLISEHVSQFVCSIIARFSDSPSFEAEIGIVEEYVSLILSELLSRRLPPQLEELGSQTLVSVGPLLDMASLSQCVVKLLEFPASSLVITTHYEDGELVWATWAGKILWEFLQHLILLLEADPLFINSTQIAKLIRPSDLELCAGTRASLKDVESCAINERIQIKAAFNFEQNTRQKVSEFAKVFELLPCHKDISFTEFAVFALDSLPQLAAVFRPDLFTELFKDPLTSLHNPDKIQLFTSIVKNVKGSFLLYEQWLARHVPTVVKQDKWSLIHIYLEANVHFSGGYSQTVEAVKQTVNSVLNKLDATSFSQSLPSLRLLSLAVQNNDPAFQKLLTDTLVGYIRKHKECQLLHFLVLEACAGFSLGFSYARQAGQSSNALVLELAVGHLAYMGMTEGTSESTSLREYLSELVKKMTERLAEGDWKVLVPGWLDLAQHTVTHKLTDAKLLKLVADMAEKVVSQSPDSAAPQRLFEQCVGHTLFLPVMTSPEFKDAKVELVKLVYTLGGLHPSGFKRAGLRDVLIAAYTASLSRTDQRLLLMMESCSRSLGTQFECPTLWGKSALDHQEVTEVLGASLHRHAPSQAILEQLHPDLMKDSILHFPVRRLHLGNAIGDASQFKSHPECYDPAFLLKLFVQILSPDKQVPLRVFVEKDCLSYLLISLSSHDLHSRLLAYHALNDFYLHTDGARWHDKLEMTFILDLLNASRVKDGQKLPFVVALFLARTVKLLLYPADLMYVPIFRFLVARPMMDLGNVPEFYKLFFSAGVQYKQERNWMLSLLCDGMRETSDYWLYQKKFIFKILLSFYDSAISDDHSQELILLMVKNACKEKSVAVDLVKNHGLLPWLAAAVTTLEQRPEQTDLLCDIIHTLWLSLTEIRYLTQTQTGQRKSQGDSASVISETESMDDEDNEPGRTAENESINRSSLKAADGEVETHLDSDKDNGDMNSKEDSRSNVGRPTKVSRPTVPRSTAVEMALVTKSLIWHLSSSSVDGLMNVLQVLHGMVSSQTLDPSLDTPTPHVETEPVSNAQDLLNLSPLESCLLLYHVSKAAQQTAIAAEAASVLKSTGMDVERKPKKLRKSSSKKEHSAVSSSTADVPLVDSVADLEEGRVKDSRKSVRLTDESESNCLTIRKDAKRDSLGSEDDRKRLFKLFHEIVTFSGTLEFV